jgi:hypothetical protein
MSKKPRNPEASVMRKFIDGMKEDRKFLIEYIFK